MSVFAKSVLLLLVFTFASAKRITVRIINTLEGKEDLHLHCRSKQDDLGLHLLRLSAKNGMALVKVTNSLDGNLDLAVFCERLAIEPYVIRPGTYYDLIDTHANNAFEIMPLFFCFFQWKGAFHNFDLCLASGEDGDCQQCHWLITEDGPCRYQGANKTCVSWT
ncbi:unnamed protein product [Sphenostylis stenocarpa]|uniref:S-protein homolog n=1 Tax=Sphenostylis stenocarpa TaxID=92480 RepID=A0AA86RMB6_9FABA|nr:unnamed protein product [Sphenostylis stenocarpa]